MSEKEAVAEETNADAEVEKRAGVDPFDAALAEFTEGTTDPISQPEPKATEISAQEIALVKAEAKKIQDERFRKEISQTIEDIRGDVPADVFDDDMIEGWLNAIAIKQPQFAVAFQQKGQKPKEWDKVRSSLKNMLSDKVDNLRKKIEAAEVQADRFAVTQAVRGASTRVAAEPPPDLSRMSNAELARFTRDNYGF